MFVTFGPTHAIAGRLPFGLEVVQVTAELVLAEMVRGWAEKRFPDDPRAADLAVLVAEHAFRSGASVSESCERAMNVVTSRSRHPSKRRGSPGIPDRLAS